MTQVPLNKFVNEKKMNSLFTDSGVELKNLFMMYHRDSSEECIQALSHFMDTINAGVGLQTLFVHFVFFHRICLICVHLGHTLVPYSLSYVILMLVNSNYLLGLSNLKVIIC